MRQLQFLPVILFLLTEIVQDEFPSLFTSNRISLTSCQKLPRHGLNDFLETGFSSEVEKKRVAKLVNTITE